MAPLPNHPIMSGISIGLFRHLEHQNLSIISDYIGIPNRSKKNGEKSKEQEEEGNLIHIKEDFKCLLTGIL